MKKLRITGVIDEKTEERVYNFLDSLADNEEFEVYINSPGGYVYAGLGIYNELAEYNPVIKIVGFAASMASVIACAGKKVMIAETATMLVHKPWTIAWGDEDDMEKVKKELTTIKEAIKKAYITKTGKSAEYIEDLLLKDESISAEDCLKHGLADEIYKPSESENRFARAKFDYAAMFRRNQKNEINDNLNNHGGDMLTNEQKLAKYDVMEANFDRVTDENAELTLENKKLKADLAKQKELHEEDIAALNSNIQNLQKEFNAKKTEIEIDAFLAKNANKIKPAEKDELREELIAFKGINQTINGKSLYDRKVAEIEARKPFNDGFNVDVNGFNNDEEEDDIIKAQREINK